MGVSGWVCDDVAPVVVGFGGPHRPGETPTTPARFWRQHAFAPKFGAKSCVLAPKKLAVGFWGALQARTQKKGL